MPTRAKFEGFDPDDIAEQLGKHNGRMVFEDCLGICRFTARTTMANLGPTVGLTTGWSDFSGEEALAVGRRTANLLRVFNLRSGFTPDLESPRSGTARSPWTDRSPAGASPSTGSTCGEYYELMGWDYESGRPLPETLERLGLAEVIPQVWG